jgi:Domain of unknown function (DUF4878)
VGYLDPYTRRRIAAVLLVAVVVIAGLAIADVGPFSDPPTEEERAADTVERFFGAAAEGDFDTFCGLLTKEARQAIEVSAGSVATEQNLKGCAEILDTVAGKQFKGSELRVVSSNVSGDQARVETELKIEDEAGKQQRSVLLQESKGEWYVEDFE